MGLETLEEADTKHDYDRSMASEFRAVGRRIYRRPRSGLFQLHKRCGCSTGGQRLG